MKLFFALNVLLAASTSQFAYASNPASSIGDAVGDGCANNIKFSGAYVTDSGEACDSCHFCDETRLVDLFSPKSDGLCIECPNAKDACDSLQVTSSFDMPWIMKFVEHSASSMASDFDPKQITLDGSSDATSWKKLYDSADEPGPIFETRDEACEYVFKNNEEHTHFRITYKLSDGTTKTRVGHYGLVPTYMKQCASNLFVAITGHHILPYETSSITSSPSNAPSILPTQVKFKIQQGFCVTSNGSDQNGGVFLLENYLNQNECLDKCVVASTTRAVKGCELIVVSNEKGRCYIHTREVARGSDVPGYYCWVMPYEIKIQQGFCVTSNGSDQNGGVFLLENYLNQNECLDKCVVASTTRAVTGCELIVVSNEKGRCYIHTREVARGSDVSGYHCWVF